MSITEYYNKTVSTKRKTLTDSIYGTQTVSWATKVSSYACRFSSMSGDKKVNELGELIQVDYKVYGGTGDILAGDILVDGTQEYDIISVYSVYNISTFHHLEFLIKRRT